MLRNRDWGLVIGIIGTVLLGLGLVIWGIRTH